MIHVISLFAIAPDPEIEDNFSRELRIGGEWHRRARLIAPDLVAADLLRHQGGPLYVCHDIWTNAAAYSRASKSRDVQQLFLERRRMAIDAHEMGPFSAPGLGESKKVLEFRHLQNSAFTLDAKALCSFAAPNSNPRHSRRYLGAKKGDGTNA
jgi:hypothetical protein